MTRFLFQRFCPIVCLVAFCFQAIAGIGLIRCTDPSGSTRLEWGCDRNEAGLCVNSSEDAPHEQHESPKPRPCEDTRVQSEISAAIERSTAQPHSLSADGACFILSPAPIDPLPKVLTTRRVEPRAAAPPPWLTFVQTIILLV